MRAWSGQAVSSTERDFGMQASSETGWRDIRHVSLL